MQKVAELAQLTHMDKIHQQAKLGQTMACLACLPLNYALFKTKKMLSANHADFSFNSLNTTSLWPNYPFLGFFAPKTYFGLIAAKLGCSGIYVTKSNVLLFLLRNYAAFSFMTPKRCFRLFVAKFTLFSALSH